MLFTLHRGKEYQYIEMVDYNDTDNNIEACCTNADEQDGTRYFLVFPRYAKNLSTHFFVCEIVRYTKWSSFKELIV